MKALGQGDMLKRKKQTEKSFLLEVALSLFSVFYFSTFLLNILDLIGIIDYIIISI